MENLTKASSHVHVLSCNTLGASGPACLGYIVSTCMIKICVHVNSEQCPAAKKYADNQWVNRDAANTPDPFLLLQLAASNVLQGCTLTAPSLNAAAGRVMKCCLPACRGNERAVAGDIRGPLPGCPASPLQAWRGPLSQWSCLCKLQVSLQNML